MVITKKMRVDARTAIMAAAMTSLILSTAGSYNASAFSFSTVKDLIGISHAEKNRLRNVPLEKAPLSTAKENPPDAVQPASGIQLSSANITRSNSSLTTNQAVTSQMSATNLPPSPPDMASESLQTAEVQAQKSVQPVVYHSSKISSDHRDELLHVSMVAAGLAGTMYALSYTGVLWRLFYGEPTPSRRTIIVSQQ